MTTTALPAPRTSRKSPWRRLITPLVVLIVVGIAVYFGYQQITGARAAATTGFDTRAVSRGTLTASVAAAGNIQSAAQINLNFSQGGILKEVLVKEGAVVKAGQPLARLEAEELELSLAASEANLRNAQLKLEQAKTGAKQTALSAAQAKLDASRAALDKLKAGATPQDIADAEAKIVSARANLTKLRTQTTAQDVADARAKVVTAQANLDKVKTGATEQEIANARLKVDSAKNSLWSAQAGRDRTCGMTTTPDADAPCNQGRASVANAEIGVVTAENDLAKLLAGANANDVTVAEQNLLQAQNALAKLQAGANVNDITVSEQNLRQAENALAKLRLPPTESDLAQAESNVVQAQAALDDLMAGPDVLTVQSAQIAVDQAQVSLKQAQLKLRQATIFAPYDGVITVVAVVPGQNIGASGNPLQIADLTNLQIVTNVSELDRSRIKVGQEVQLTLEALTGVTLRGEVISISPAGVTQQGVVNFPVTIRLINPDPSIAPGMTANLSVIIERKENVVLVPNRAVRTQGRQRVVNVLYEGQQIPVVVQTGMTDGQNTEITGGGVKEGDQVVMTTTTAANRAGGGFPGPGGGGGVIIGR